MSGLKIEVQLLPDDLVRFYQPVRSYRDGEGREIVLSKMDSGDIHVRIDRSRSYIIRAEEIAVQVCAADRKATAADHGGVDER